MDLEKGIEILVRDWRDLHEDGGTPLSVEEVVANLPLGDRNAITPDMKTGQIAELIINALRRIPVSLENAEKFMAQFDSAEELLEEIDLDCLVSDLSLAEEDL